MMPGWAKAHILRAWDDNVCDKVRVAGTDEVSKTKAAELQATCKAELRDLMRASDIEQFEQLKVKLLRTWRESHPGFVKYFETEWLVKRTPTMWANPFRTHAHFGIDTNNLIEGWHGNLKVNYLGFIRLQRADHVVQVLVREVFPDFYRELVQCKLGIRIPHLCLQERQARKKAYALSYAELGVMVTNLYGETFEVKSASDPTLSHTVQADVGTCTCPVFESTSLICKHLFICSRATGLPVFRLRRNVQDTAISNAEDQAPAATTEYLPVDAEAAIASEEAERERLVNQQKRDHYTACGSEIERLIRAYDALGTDSTILGTSRATFEHLQAEITAARRTAEGIRCGEQGDSG
ncbi:hypothetical protein CF327_g916 [Tilletia walkeri]|nr:hypothetical protein CF327_g916 [Tilletia walkeri]